MCQLPSRTTRRGWPRRATSHSVLTRAPGARGAGEVLARLWVAPAFRAGAGARRAARFALALGAARRDRAAAGLARRADGVRRFGGRRRAGRLMDCLLYTSDAADERS